AFGPDLRKALNPLLPVARYAMGGVRTDLRGGPSLPGLYAAGEVAATGVHGANRLASNSPLEGLVFGAAAGAAMLEEEPAGGGARGAASQCPRGIPHDLAEAVMTEVRCIAWEQAVTR